MSTDPAQTVFDQWLATFGRGRCDRIMRTHFKARLQNPGREKRKELKPKQKEKLYAIQNGRCAECGDPFGIKELEWDHIDPNRQDFNKFPANWQGLCHGCHKEKGAKSVMEQTKHYGRPATEILKQEDEAGNEFTMEDP